MPAKIARSAPRPPFELPKVMVAVRTSLLSCRKAGKNANIHASPGVIWRIPEYIPTAPATKQPMRKAKNYP